MTGCSVLERAMDGYRGVPEIVLTVGKLFLLRGPTRQTTAATSWCPRAQAEGDSSAGHGSPVTTDAKEDKGARSEQETYSRLGRARGVTGRRGT
jgi:hypothetical protein